MTASNLLAISGIDLTENTIGGVALGCRYALIALAFVMVYRATGVINFATGAFALLGGYLTYTYSQTWGLDYSVSFSLPPFGQMTLEVGFYLSILLAMVSGFLFGALLEAVLLRKLIDAQPFTVVMITIGLLFIMTSGMSAIWGNAPLRLGDPWTGNTANPIGEIGITHRHLWAMGLTAVTLFGFTLLFRYTKVGLAMRATALDPEAAQAQGIHSRNVYRVTWGLAGLVAALAGVMFSAGSSSLDPVVASYSLAAFPAMILGGLDSPLGAVVGGIIIGIVQQLTQLFAVSGHMDWAGESPQLIAPYAVMLIILMVRPYGLFGTKEVRRA